MHVMLLAAGRGERMMPLTRNTPKPLLAVAGKRLIEHQITRLVNQGYHDFVINLGYLGEQIKQQLGDGSNYNCVIEYSDEGEQILETGGGIKKALCLLQGPEFLVVNTDIWTDFDFSSLPENISSDAHLLLVPNPVHNDKGDFSLENGFLKNAGPLSYTYSGIGIFTRRFFTNSATGRFPLAPLIRSAADKNQVTAQIHEGLWFDIGTPDRLDTLKQLFLK